MKKKVKVAIGAAVLTVASGLLWALDECLYSLKCWFYFLTLTP
jgi:hypothetical protein